MYLLAPLGLDWPQVLQHLPFTDTLYDKGGVRGTLGEGRFVRRALEGRYMRQEEAVTSSRFISFAMETERQVYMPLLLLIHYLFISVPVVSRGRRGVGWCRGGHAPSAGHESRHPDSGHDPGLSSPVFFFQFFKVQKEELKRGRKDQHQIFWTVPKHAKRQDRTREWVVQEWFE
jgi:hypothetical protein